MSQALVRTGNKGMSLVPQTLTEATELANLLAQSTIVPVDFRGKPGDVLVAMMMGGEVGLSPIQSLQNIAVINGRPCIWGDSAKALVMVHPDFEWSNEGVNDDERIGLIAWVEVKRKNHPVLRVEFTQVDAVKAGLWGNIKKDPWIKYPKQMLLNRARAFAFRNKFPDALRGLAIREEVEDYTDVEYTVTVEDEKEKKTEKIVDNANDVTGTLSSELSGLFNNKQEENLSGDDILDILKDEFDAKVTGIVEKESDEKKEEVKQEQAQVEIINESERRMIYARLKEAELTADDLKEKFNIEHLKTCPKALLPAIVDYLKQKKEEAANKVDKWKIVYAKIVNHFGVDNKQLAHAFIKKVLDPIEIKRVSDLAELPVERLDDLEASINWEIQLTQKDNVDIDDLLG